MADKTDEREHLIPFEDELEILDAGGPEDHAIEQSVGQLLPGPASQSVGSVGPFDKASVLEDRGGLKDAGGAKDGVVGRSTGVALPGSPLRAPRTKQSTDPEDRAAITGIIEHHVWELQADTVKRIGQLPSKAVNAESVEDELDLNLGGPAEFNPYTPTLDTDGHQHVFSSPTGIYRLFPFDFRNAPWNDPTSYLDFTGYGRDGTRYTNGVQDVGTDTVAGVPNVVGAPWALESSGAHRSSRQDAPEVGLIAVGQDEVIIYDLDNYPTSLDVWMRFILPTGSTYYFAGRNPDSVRWAKFLDGVLYLATQYTGGTAVNGALFAIDFRRTGKECIRYIRSDAQGRALAGKTIVDRNSTSWWESDGAERLENEYCYQLDVHPDFYDYRLHHVVLSGEDNVELVRLYDNDLINHSPMAPAPAANAGRTRFACFDASGALFVAWSNADGTSQIFRNVADYRGGVLNDPFHSLKRTTRARYAHRRLPFYVEWMAATPLWIIVASAEGIWLIDRNTLDYHLAYTDEGGNLDGVYGGGRQDNPPDGAVLLGDKNGNRPVTVWNGQKTSFLFISNIWGGGGVAVVRLHDDVASYSAESPVLQEDGAYIAAGIVV